MNGQNKESKSNPKRKKPLLREPLQKSLDNLEIDYLFSDKTGSAIGFDSLKKEYESNNELQLLMDFNTFLTFTITYFEDKNITVIPF